MTDLDQLSRAVKDLEYRVKALEKAHDALVFIGSREPAVPIVDAQWCECGRDICRAPNCFSHKPDPTGR